MAHARRFAVLSFLLALPDPSEAQTLSRVLCDPADPATRCPGEFCLCIDDVLEVTFGATGANVLETSSLAPGAPIEVTIVLDTTSPKIFAWSYGVTHDDAVLNLQSVTIDGTRAAIARNDGFVFVSHQNIADCESVEDPRCPDPPPGHGFISAIILSFIRPIALPLGRNDICKASYTLAASPNATGTLVRFTPWLKFSSSARTDISLTDAGEIRRPRMVIDGLLQPAPAAPRFRRGDADGNGVLELNDAVSGLGYLFLGSSAPACQDAADANDDGILNLVDPVFLLQGFFRGGRSPPAPSPDCGEDPTQDTLTCERSPPCE